MRAVAGRNTDVYHPLDSVAASRAGVDVAEANKPYGARRGDRTTKLVWPTYRGT